MKLTIGQILNWAVWKGSSTLYVGKLYSGYEPSFDLVYLILEMTARERSVIDRRCYLDVVISDCDNMAITDPMRK